MLLARNYVELNLKHKAKPICANLHKARQEKGFTQTPMSKKFHIMGISIAKFLLKMLDSSLGHIVHLGTDLLQET